MLMHIKRLLRPRSILIIVALFTILATIAFLMPGSSIPTIRMKMFVWMDKVLHAGIHFLLVFGWLLYYVRHNSKVKIGAFIYISLSCVVYGIIIEVLQGLAKTRASELADVFANITGTIIGLLVFLAIKSKIKMKA